MPLILGLNIGLALVVPALVVWSRWWLGGSGTGIVVAGVLVAVLAVLYRTLLASRDWRRETLRIGAFALLLAPLCYRWIAATARLDGYGEGLYDLHYLAGALAATAFPAPDLWHPGSAADHYYTFGFDALAVYARALGLAPGTAYALGLALLPWATAVNLFALMRGGFVRRALAALSGTFAASGLSLLVGARWVDLPPHAIGYAHTRLLDLSEWAAQPLAQWLGGSGAYPIESPAGLVFELGDLHPPLFGFYLLSVWLLCIYAVKDSRWRLAGMGVLWAPAFVANAWALPLFVAVSGAYALVAVPWRRWLHLVGGVAIGMVLVAPWLATIAVGGDLVKLAWLPAENRSTPATFAMVWAPQLLAAALLLPRWRLLLVPALFVCVLLGLEVVLLDDPYGGAFERFNGVLKLGSLALLGWTVALLAEATRERRSWRAWAVVLVLAIPAGLQLRDVSDEARAMRPVNWSLAPDVLLRREDHRALYRALAERPRGLTLEQVRSSAYDEAPMVATLLGWPTGTGWWSHLQQVHELTDQEAAAQQRYQQFYTAPAWRGFAGLPKPAYILVDYDLGWRVHEPMRRAARMPGYEFIVVARRADGVVAGYFRRRG